MRADDGGAAVLERTTRRRAQGRETEQRVTRRKMEREVDRFWVVRVSRGFGKLVASGDIQRELEIRGRGRKSD